MQTSTCGFQSDGCVSEGQRSSQLSVVPVPLISVWSENGRPHAIATVKTTTMTTQE